MRRSSGQEGAAAVEFGLLLPLLVMLAFGIIEFSTAYNRSQGMQAGVREGARLAASSSSDDPVTVDEVRIAVRNALQTNAGGSGFPAPGGAEANDADQLVADVEVTVSNLTSVSDTASPPLTDPAAVACDTGVDSVRIVASITDTENRQADYGLSLPLIPGSPFHLDHRAEAVFRCLN